MPPPLPLPLLRTKLFVPQVQQHLVVRQRLLQRLEAGQQRTLTLVSAPAGFGKTTLVRAWLGSSGRPAAWLSLDEGDNDPVRFLAYLVAALQTVAPAVGASLPGGAGAHGPQPPPSEAILTMLINDISAVSDPFVLVLDDYHRVDAEPIDRALTFLIEHLPPQLHLIITTRQDPALPLARLRARGQMTELRASDLRFTPDEAAEYLNQVMGLDLSAADIAALEGRTEGWIAGLQLAVLSLQGHQDVPGFIRAFAGDHRFIADYLVDEVLQRQPADVRAFLLQTSILDRLHGPLCDAVTGQVGGAAQLEALARGNVFVVPLDDQRRWYRYHHLFADVLRSHLQQEQPALVPMLHQRASAWYAEHAALDDAIRHAQAGQDHDRAADLIERALPPLRRGRLGVTLHGWLQGVPDDVLRRRPVLTVTAAWALMAVGEFDGADARLQDAERWLDATGNDPDAHISAANGLPEELRRVPGMVSAYRAAHAQALGRQDDAMRHAQQALERTDADEHLVRGAAAALLGLAHWSRGELNAAVEQFAAGMAHLDQMDMEADVITGDLNISAMQVAQGRLREATRTLEQAVQRARQQRDPGLYGLSDLLVRQSEIACERNLLALAHEQLQTSQQVARGIGVMHNHARWTIALAQVRAAEGDLDGALTLLDEAERRYERDYAPNLRPIPALRARIWIAQGRMDAALDWARAAHLAPTDDLSYLREFEHLTLARLLLAEHTQTATTTDLQQLTTFVQRLLRAAEEGDRVGSVIEAFLLLAHAQTLASDQPAALAALARALQLAEPDGYVRLFLDAGPPVGELLATYAAQRTQPVSAHVRQVLAAVRLPGASAADTTAPTPTIPPAHHARDNDNDVEALSARELDVLRLLATEMSGPEIARELSVSLNTLRTHTKNIYSKLGVSTRRAAVRRATELTLLTQPHTRPRTH